MSSLTGSIRIKWERPSQFVLTNHEDISSGKVQGIKAFRRILTVYSKNYVLVIFFVRNEQSDRIMKRGVCMREQGLGSLMSKAESFFKDYPIFWT